MPRGGFISSGRAKATAAAAALAAAPDARPDAAAALRAAAAGDVQALAARALSPASLGAPDAGGGGGGQATSDAPEVVCFSVGCKAAFAQSIFLPPGSTSQPRDLKVYVDATDGRVISTRDELRTGVSASVGTGTALYAGVITRLNTGGDRATFGQQMCAAVPGRPLQLSLTLQVLQPLTP
jgi:hypothetical protein